MVETNARAMARVQALMEMRQGAVADARRRRTELLATIPEGAERARHGRGVLDAAMRPLQAARGRVRRGPPRRAARPPRAGGGAGAPRRRAGALPEGAGEGAARPHRRRGPRGPRRARVPRGGAAASSAASTPRRAGGRSSPRSPATTRCCAPGTWRRCRAAPTRRRRRRSSRRTSPRCSGWWRPPSCRRARPRRIARGSSGSRCFAALGAGLGGAGSRSGSTGRCAGPEDAGALGVPVLAAIPRIGPG